MKTTRKYSVPLNVDDFNDIQAQWMALDSTGPKSEIDRVCKLMQLLPAIHISGHDGKGAVIQQGQPLTRTMDFDECVSYCKNLGGRTDLAWNGTTGQWYSLPAKSKVCGICGGSHPVGCCAQDGHGG